jgi:hypothetical protein
MSGESAGNEMSPPLETTWPGNISHTTLTHVLAVWAVSPSCWNHNVLRPTPQQCNSKVRKLLNISTYRADVTITADPPSSKK